MATCHLFFNAKRVSCDVHKKKMIMIIKNKSALKLCGTN